MALRLKLKWMIPNTGIVHLFLLGTSIFGSKVSNQVRGFDLNLCFQDF